IGGETAEMPGFYPIDEYDLAGFCVGMADKSKLIDGSGVKCGDAIIAIASTGVHSNGFSLVRKALNVKKENLNIYIDELGKTLGEELLTPTKIYVKALLTLMDQVHVNAVSHITGGGFYENIPRMLQDGHKAVIHRAAVNVLPIFNVIAKTGDIPERDMFNTFNMGVGLMAAVPAAEADKAINVLKAIGENAYIIGEIVKGDKGVEIV
ncbi:MAG: phosphoribosylformylglycinamidine cyclo-ligase, partial [Oscillospiraceae bacterium]